MKPVHHFPFYGNDFFQAVDGYSDAVIVGYLRALWHYWHHLHCDGIPDDDDYLKRICRCDTSIWIRTKGIIFDNNLFFKLEDGKWHQGRMKQERDKTISAYNAKVAAAAKARLHNPNNSTVDSTDVRTDNKKSSRTLSKLKPEPEPEPDVQNSSVCIGEVELPIGFPKSKDEAGTASAFVGCPVEFAYKVWEKAMSRNGRDSKDVPIRQWRFFLSSSWKYEQEQQSKDEQVNEKSSRVSTRGSRVIPNYANGF